MLILVLLTLALILATWFLLFVMQRGFMRGVSWFDERSKERERTLAERRARFIKEQQAQARRTGARPSLAEDEEEEWAEYIDV